MAANAIFMMVSPLLTTVIIISETVCGQIDLGEIESFQDSKATQIVAQWALNVPVELYGEFLWFIGNVVLKALWGLHQPPSPLTDEPLQDMAGNIRDTK